LEGELDTASTIDDEDEDADARAADPVQPVSLPGAGL
jgi:hypothetical protein